MIDDIYEVHALRYATRGARKGTEFFRYDLYGQPDAALDIDYSCWLVRNDHRTVPVKCGFAEGPLGSSRPVLARRPHPPPGTHGRAPEDVDHIVISHMHDDHIGNKQFPLASAGVIRAELEWWSDPVTDCELLRDVGDPAETQVVHDMRAQQRLHLVDSMERMLPGITMTPLGAHTPGRAIVEVMTDAGPGAARLERRSSTTGRTTCPPTSPRCIGDDVLRELGAHPDRTLVAEHDPRVASMFHAMRPERLDLTRRVDG